MISFSTYVKTADHDLDGLLGLLNIRTVNAVAHSDPNCDYAFFAQSQNGMLFTKVGGAFEFACDVTLFDTAPEGLHDLLRTCSTHNMSLAIPDESTEDPFSYIYFVDGRTEHVSLHANELTDEVKIAQRGLMS